MSQPETVTDLRAVGSRRPATDRALKEIFTCICGLAVAGSMFLSATGGQEQIFAASARVKDVVLPLTFVLIIAGLLTQRRRIMTGWPISLVWVPVLGTLIIVSAAAEISHSAGVSIVSIGQDLVEFAALGFGALAARAVSRYDFDVIVRGLIATGAVISVLPAAAVPFSALMLPALVASFKMRKSLTGWWRLMCPALLLGIGSHWYSAGGAYFSGARTLQVLGIVGVCLINTVIKKKRPKFGSVLIVSIVAFLLIMLGTGPGRELSGLKGSPTDVSLAQRYYEMQRVSYEESRSPLKEMVGGGPGATFDLTSAPDSATLIAAGRNIAAVDDAHLLVAHVRLKLGLAGLAWLFLLLWCLIRVIYDGAINLGNDASLGASLMLISFVAFGAPAATNFLANPLFGLIFGVLALTSQRYKATAVVSRSLI